MKPILFKIGSLPIRSWGVLVALGFIAGLYVAQKRAKNYNIDSNKIYDLSFYILVTGIISGRLVFILFDLNHYLKNPLQIIMFQNGGMAIHGALIGSFIAAYIFCRKNNISLLNVGDLLGPSVLLGQAIGRLGCFLNGDDYGYVTKSFLGVTFPGLGNQPRLPTQLFETFFDLIAFALLIFLSKKIKKEGQIFYISIIFYSVIRFGVELFRDDMGHIIGWLTYGEAVSIVMILIAAIALVKGLKSQESPT